VRIIRQQAYARAGLVGNPSDGYFGRTISLVVRSFSAQVTLYDWDELEIVPSRHDHSRFGSIRELADDVRHHGYYGGIRLLKATIKKFVEYCDHQGHPLHEQNFAVRYESNIPRQVGLGGSSAIIVATLRALMGFYDVAIDRQVLPSLALSVEKEELGIGAGLQDRVIQVYGGLVYMDFSRERMQTIEGYSCGCYEPLDPGGLPPIYVAYKCDAGEPTEVFHNNLRVRFERGERDVVEAMRGFAELAERARDAILAENGGELAQIIDANYNLRRSICQIPAWQDEMVRAARNAGASAKFAGSGGAIVGTYSDETMYARLVEALQPLRCQVVRPRLTAE